MNNPFILEPNVPKEFFCDRQEEQNAMLYDLTNRANITLISPRRYGKTGLIFRVFDEIEHTIENTKCFYVDIYSSHDIDGFISLLTESVMKVLSKKRLIERFFNIIGAIRPTLSYDPFTNSTQVSYTFSSEVQKRQTLKSIFEFLDSQDYQSIIAIDEFQQIREYDNGDDMEAILRTYIQPLKNVHFVFCGSKKHIMTEMFTDARRPFYESTQCLHLKSIDHDIYKDFIIHNFKKGNIIISNDIVEMILDWTYGHTFYTQTLCHYLYRKCRKEVKMEDFYDITSMLLRQREDTFLEQRNLITKGQWQFLKAVAKEGILTKPTSSAFLQKYNFGGASIVTRMLNALIEKELILSTATAEGNTYRVYNVFLSRWLEKQ